MPRRTQAEIFIRTLEEMLDRERQVPKARQRLWIRAHVERFVSKFRTDPDGARPASEWTPTGKRTPEDAPSRIETD